MNAENGFFQGMNPKASFGFGFVSGVALAAILGLVLILTSGLSLGGTAKGATVAVAPSPAAAPAAGDVAAPAGNPDPISSDDHVRGAKNAKVTLIEYSDFECPFCKQFHTTLLQAMQDFPNDLAIAYRHYPLSFHQNAQKEAEASECAAELGGNDAFWAFHDKVFERTTSNGTGFALTDLGPLAKEIGLDQTKFQNCLDSGKYAQKVMDEENSGTNVGVTGTPGTFLVDANGNSQLISGAVPYANLKSAIQAAIGN